MTFYRLVRYNAATKKNQVLVHDLGFANGVALSEDEQFVIVMETTRSRITKYNIKGPNAGKSETFIEGLPGLPDNVHSDNNNGFLVSLVVYADSQHPHLSQSLTPHPYLRRMAARLLMLLEAPFKCLNSYYPNIYAEKVAHYIGGFESFLFLAPKVVTVLRIDNKGKIVEAAYSTDDNIASISSAYIHNDFLWLGSPFAEYIARVPLKQAFPDLKNTKKVDGKAKPAETVEKKTVPNTSAEQKPSPAAQTSGGAKPSSTTQAPVERKASSTPQSSGQQKPSSTTQAPKRAEAKPSEAKKSTSEKKPSRKEGAGSAKN